MEFSQLLNCVKRSFVSLSQNSRLMFSTAFYVFESVEYFFSQNFNDPIKKWNSHNANKLTFTRNGVVRFNAERKRSQLIEPSKITKVFIFFSFDANNFFVRFVHTVGVWPGDFISQLSRQLKLELVCCGKQRDIEPTHEGGIQKPRTFVAFGSNKPIFVQLHLCVFRFSMKQNRIENNRHRFATKHSNCGRGDAVGHTYTHYVSTSGRRIHSTAQ